MNQRNVEAIYELLSEAHTELLAYAGEQDQVHRTAAFLAARGVLAPSALGQDPDDKIQFDMVITEDRDGEPGVDLAKLTEALVRIAKGEPHPYRLDTFREAKSLADELAQETCEHGVLLFEKCIDCELEHRAKGEGQGGNH